MKTSQKFLHRDLLLIFGFVIAVVMLVVIRLLMIQGQGRGAVKQFPPIDGGAVACTLEAKICPDGSAVGRQGPNCEFAPCPGE